MMESTSVVYKMIITQFLFRDLVWVTLKPGFYSGEIDPRMDAPDVIPAGYCRSMSTSFGVADDDSPLLGHVVSINRE